MDILQGWKNTIKTIESEKECTDLLKNLRGYLKLVFGNQKGNIRRKDVVDGLQKLSFDITVLVGLSCPDARQIDSSVCEAIVKLYSDFQSHFTLNSIFNRKNVREKILSVTIAYAENIRDGRIGFDELRDFKEAEPQTSRKHGRNDSEQTEIDIAERPLKTRPKPSHGHGGSISENDQRLARSDYVEEEDGAEQEHDVEEEHDDETNKVPKGDIFALDILSLIDVVFQPELVTSIMLTILEADADPDKASFLTIWALRGLGDELAKKHALKQVFFP
ncbi:hypothetical protein FCOIX_5940 [Fusarium coicis]|nr:hypothetical protein FCOIX_5940 [Fusarium coicis]